jgi:signal transduction histidine kinase
VFPGITTKSFGVGLGMPTIKEIIKLPNGDVQVQSEEGKGTTVTLWLPLSIESSKLSPHRPPGETDSGLKSILAI